MGRHGTDVPDSRVMDAPDRDATTTARPVPAIRASALPVGEPPEASLPVPRPAGRSRIGKARAKRSATTRAAALLISGFNGRRARRDEDMDDMPRRGGRRRPKNTSRPVSQATQPIKAAKRKIRVEEAIRVADMAHQMGPEVQ